MLAAILDGAIEECSKKLASNGATGTRLQKKLMQKWGDSSLEQAIEAGIEHLPSFIRLVTPIKEFKKPPANQSTKGEEYCGSNDCYKFAVCFNTEFLLCIRLKCH